MSQCRRRPEWSELQRSLLELILEKLDLAAHARFASVCSSWRSVAVENPPINKPLYFALSHRPKRLVRRFITSFAPSWTEARFIGALDGWLAITIDVDGLKLFLLNKGLNSMIPLPSPPKDPYDLHGDYCKAVLSSPPPPSPSSPGDSCTIILKHEVCGLYYCRLGLDNSFSKLSDGNTWDILFYEGRLYVICEYNTVRVFDHLLNKMTQLVEHLGDSWGGSYRLLISENKLLFVGTPPCHYYVLTSGEEESQQRLIRVDNINDKLLILNYYCSLSISTKGHSEFRRTEIGDYYDTDTSILDTSKDPNKAKEGDPWPLFFVMFNAERFRP